MPIPEKKSVVVGGSPVRTGTKIELGPGYLGVGALNPEN